MNVDFHYHATHLAARYAGFSKEEANIIAYAAQFVDDCTKSNAPADSPKRYTCMSIGEMEKMNLKPVDWKYEDYRKLTEIWQYFHFLPGNEFYTNRYSGKRSNKRWTFSEEDEEIFRKMCKPQSVAIWNMIEDTKRYRGTSNFLHMIGMRMHVLADTWAHQNFIGFPLWFANEVDSDSVEVEVNGKWKKVTYYSWRLSMKDSLEFLSFSNTPTMDSYESISYLGHGRLGTVADIPCLRFRYQPAWMEAKTLLTRSNVDVFTDAFHQMVYAMRCIKDNTSFDPEYISSEYKAKVAAVLNVWKIDQSNEWDQLIKKEFGYIPDAYDAKKWKKEYEEEKKLGNYILFINSANDHVSLMNSITNTARFQHCRISDKSIRHSSLINYLNWDKKSCSMVCVNGQMYMREIFNSYPTGKLKMVDMIEYLEHNFHDKWKCKIDMYKKEFHHQYSGTGVPDRYGTICNYCAWGDEKWEAKLIEGKYIK